MERTADTPIKLSGRKRIDVEERTGEKGISARP